MATVYNPKALVVGEKTYPEKQLLQGGNVFVVLADRLSLERVFAIIAPNGVTRDELRRMLGWMAARTA